MEFDPRGSKLRPYEKVSAGGFLNECNKDYEPPLPVADTKGFITLVNRLVENLRAVQLEDSLLLCGQYRRRTCMRTGFACLAGFALSYAYVRAKAEERWLHRRTYERLMDAVHMAR